MISAPIVSVIVPAYNAGLTLCATLDSVRAQSLPDFECWIVDDGSTDDTAAIANQFCQSDRRFQLIQQTNLGVAQARNAALAQAQGRLIAALDADDVWHPNFLSAHVSAFNASPGTVGFTSSYARTIDMSGQVKGTVLPYRLSGRIAEALRYHNGVGNPSMTVLRRDAVIAAGGYDQRLQQQGSCGSEDWLLLLRIATAWEVRFVPLYLTGYRISPQSMSTDRLRMARSFRLAEQIFSSEAARHPLPERVNRWQRSVRSMLDARQSLTSGHLLRAILQIGRGILLDPARTTAMALDILVSLATYVFRRKNRAFSDLNPHEHFNSHRLTRPFCHGITQRRLRDLLAHKR